MQIPKWPWRSRREPATAVDVDGNPSAAPWAHWPDHSGALVFAPEAVAYQAGAIHGDEQTEAAAVVWDLWPVETSRLRDAVEEASLRLDDPTGYHARWWDNRVVHSRDVMAERDPAGVEAWDRVREELAETDEHYLFEARLVAATETLLWGEEEGDRRARQDDNSWQACPADAMADRWDAGQLTAVGEASADELT